MTNISENKIIYLQDYISPNTYLRVVGGTWDSFLSIQPKNGQKQNIYNHLKNVSHIKVYKKEDIPVEYHYTNNRRIMPILVVGEEGWSVTISRKVKFKDKGNHGYSNKHKSMNPFFIARGPAFKSGYLSEPFKNVDIYPLMCHILGIEPAPNNGSLAEVQQLLRLKGHKPNSTNYTLLTALVVIAVLVLILMSYGIITFCVDHHCKMGNYGHIYDLAPEL
jgi:ectonucleotide pyrophosphatase/phosphodiesterase family protein 5